MVEQYCEVCNIKIETQGFKGFMSKPYELKNGIFCVTCGKRIVEERRNRLIPKYTKDD